MSGDSGTSVTLDETLMTSGAWRELADAFGMKDPTARFRRHGEPSAR
jgi:hypothetical protein